MIIFYSDNVYLVPTITRNCKNLFYHVSNTTVAVWWSHQYVRHWLHLCITDALSSTSFEISDSFLFPLGGKYSKTKCISVSLSVPFFGVPFKGVPGFTNSLNKVPFDLTTMPGHIILHL